MGNRNSALESEVIALKTRLSSLDYNRDGVVTKDELEQFKKDILQNKEKELFEAKNEILELKKQIESLKEINSQLQSTQNIMDTVQSHPNPISTKNIEIIVEKMLNDENVNIKYLPDFVERQLYKNMFKMILKLFDQITNNTSVNLLGHRLHVEMEPLPENMLNLD